MLRRGLTGFLTLVARVATVFVIATLALGVVGQALVPKKPPPLTAEEQEEQGRKGRLAHYLITSAKYHCAQIPAVAEWGNDHYGKVQRAWCDTENSFRVTWRTHGNPRVTVAPWRD